MNFDPTEAALQKAVLQALEYWGFLAFRVNSGKVQTIHRTWIALAPKGTSDIIAIVPRNGRFMAIEIKRPGKASNTTPEQDDFLNRVRRDGGVAIVVDQIATIDRVCQTLKIDPNAEFSRNGWQYFDPSITDDDDDHAHVDEELIRQ